MSCADLNCQDMVQGQTYTFTFRANFSSGAMHMAGDAAKLKATIADDSNFVNPTVTIPCAGGLGSLFNGGRVAVSFTYGGQGSLVGQAGQEMASIMSNAWVSTLGASFIFEKAETGVTSPCCNCDPSSLSWIGWVAAGVIVLLVLGYFAPEIFALDALKRRFAR